MRWLAGFCCLVVMVGCGGRGAAHSSSPVLGAGEGAELTDTYSTMATEGVLVGNAADAELRSALVESCRGAQLSADGRLSSLAQAVARESGESGRAPDAAQVTYHARRLGLVEPTPQLWLSRANATSAIAPALRAAVQEAARGGKLTHCGGAAVRASGGGVVVVVAFVRRLIAFDAPVARAFAPGQALKLSGQLAPGYDDAVLAITDPAGNVRRSELGRGRRIRRELRFEQRGEHTLELLATGPEGITVAAVFPVYVGVPPSLARPNGAGGEVERDAPAMMQKLTALVARERKQRGLPALEIHAGLSRIALAHSEDMRDHGFVAHTSPNTGEAKDRVQRAGIRTTLLLENIGRGYSAEEVHAGLMASPGHRANILHPDARILGVGVVTEVEGDRNAFLATQLFARLSEPVRWTSAKADLFEAISRARKQQNRPRASLDPGLSRLAEQVAQAYARDPAADEQALLDRAMREVRRLPAAASVLTAALVKAEDLSQAAESAELLDARLVALGLGIAPLPERASHALAVVLLLALRK